MKQKVKILAGQSLLDIAIQECGTLEGVIELALLNGISVTESLIAVNDLNTDIGIYDLEIATFFKRKSLLPATALTAPIQPQPCANLFAPGLFAPGLFASCENNTVNAPSLFENGLFENGLFE